MFQGNISTATNWNTCIRRVLLQIVLVMLPSVSYDTELEKITIDMEDRKPLTVYNTPVSTTYVVFDE